MKTITPIEIHLSQKQRSLRVDFEDGRTITFPCCFLRQHSPSAENRYQALPVSEDVNIESIEPVGNYAIKLYFDDGHHTGIYSFAYLLELADSLP